MHPQIKEMRFKTVDEFRVTAGNMSFSLAGSGRLSRY